MELSLILIVVAVIFVTFSEIGRASCRERV